MKKKSIILLVVLVIVAIIISVASVFVVKNWNKIHTMYYVLTGRSDELEQKYARDEEKLKETIKDIGIDGIRPLTEEESDKLSKGEISEEDAINIILGRTEETSSDSESGSTEGNNEMVSSEKTETNNSSKEYEVTEDGEAITTDKNKTEQSSEENKKTNQTKNEGTNEKVSQSKNNDGKKINQSKDDNSKKTTQTKDEQQPQVNDEKKEEQTPEYKEKNEEISRLIGELYVLKSQFSADLSAIEDWVNSQYRIFCEEYGGPENIPSSAKTKVGKRAYEKALALEDACDVKVNEILSKVKILLKETNQSVSIVNEIKASYENEKSKAISYYMSQF